MKITKLALATVIVFCIYYSMIDFLMNITKINGISIITFSTILVILVFLFVTSSIIYIKVWNEIFT